VLTFGPTADTYVLAGSPTTNYGARTTLLVDNSPVKHTLVTFTVSGVGTGGVASAKLRLYCVDSSNMGGAFYPVNAGWQEGTVTWNTAPAPGPTAVASLGAVVSGQWYEVDLTSFVTGNGTFSLRITSTSSNGADYVSKEGTAGQAPQLVVTLA
jgi:hypothetical protein